MKAKLINIKTIYSDGMNQGLFTVTCLGLSKPIVKLLTLTCLIKKHVHLSTMDFTCTMGAFNNYVDHFLPYFDHLPTYVYIR